LSSRSLDLFVGVAGSNSVTFDNSVTFGNSVTFDKYYTRVRGSGDSSDTFCEIIHGGGLGGTTPIDVAGDTNTIAVGDYSARRGPRFDRVDRGPRFYP
jgi:hypothetical protein